MYSFHIRENTLKLAAHIRKFFKLCFARFDRESIARMYLRGKGIEIGALHNPLPLPKSTKIKYVDRMSLPDLRKQYPELVANELVDVDIIDDGEHLFNIRDSSQNFVIANHFLEHCQNPISAIRNMLRVLKKGGVVYLSIPDKRYSFDADRPATPLGHFLKDYQEGPEWSKKQHFEEWTRYIDKIKDNAEVEERISHLMKLDYSIHYHTWTQAEMLEFMLTLKQKLHFNFELELMLKNMGEVIFILRKTTGEST
jgi:predicted SAM-dependent methyltransferase